MELGPVAPSPKYPQKFLICFCSSIVVYCFYGKLLKLNSKNVTWRMNMNMNLTINRQLQQTNQTQVPSNRFRLNISSLFPLPPPLSFFPSQTHFFRRGFLILLFKVWSFPSWLLQTHFPVFFLTSASSWLLHHDVWFELTWNYSIAARQ